MRSQSISVLRLSNSAGWRGDNITFIEGLDFLVGIEVFSLLIKDVSAVFQLKKIKYLALQCDIRHELDFQVLINLEVCKISWNEKITGISHCKNIRHLNLINYSRKDFTELVFLKNLQRFQVASKTISSLMGISLMPELKIFDAADCTNLNDLSDLAACKNLEMLILNSCRKIASFPQNLFLDRLTHVSLTDCGKIASLQPFDNWDKWGQINFIVIR